MTLYYKKPKGKKLNPLNCDSVVDAVGALKVLGVNTDGIEFFTEKQAKEYREAAKEKSPEELFEALAPSAKKICDTLGMNPESISREFIKQYGLDENADKPYYVYCYWNSDANGSFMDEDGIKATVREKINSYCDESFDYTIYKLPGCEQVDVAVDVKIKIDDGEWI